MLKNLFKEQKQYLDYFFATLDVEIAEKVATLCLNTKGLLVLTGMGKSGIVAEKIALTLISTGTKAIFLPTTNFLHGDIGILSPEDTVLLFSKSGETEELLTLLPFMKKRGAKTIAILSNKNGRLGRMADLTLILPVEKELCPFDLAPTTSTQVQLLFGDVLAVALMKAKKFSLESYAQNHPAGSIGKKATIKVADLMLSGHDLPLCFTSDLLTHVLEELTQKKCGCLLVVNEKKELQGIFTDGDFRRAIQSLGQPAMHMSMEALMTKKPSAVSQDLLAWEALKIMQKDPGRWMSVLPVLEGGRVIGLLRMHDIIHVGI